MTDGGTKRGERRNSSDSDGLLDDGDAPNEDRSLVGRRRSNAYRAVEDAERHHDGHAAVRDIENATSNLQTMMNLLKANIGTGVLAMPYAFKNSGLMLGLIGLAFFGTLCVHCMHMLVGAANYFCRQYGYSALSYADVVELCFDNSPFKYYAQRARKIVQSFLYLTQFGFCCIYFVFIAKSLENVVEFYWEPLPIRVYMVMTLPFMLAYALIRDLKRLAPFSLAANIIMIAGLFVVFQFMLQRLKQSWEVTQFGPISKFPLFFGTAIYAFEGIGCILPIENKMKHPEDFGGRVGVLNTGMVIVATLYCATGFFGYLAFGDDVRDSITLNMPQTWPYQIVKLLFAVVVFISYGIQFYVPMEMLWPPIAERIESPSRRHAAEVIMRISLVLFTFALAILIPKLGLFISLVGAVGSAFLAMIMPPIMDIVYRMGRHDLSHGACNWRMWKNIAILLIGLVGGITGTTITIRDIVQAFHHDDKPHLPLTTTAIPLLLANATSAIIGSPAP